MVSRPALRTHLSDPPKAAYYRAIKQHVALASELEQARNKSERIREKDLAVVIRIVLRHSGR